MGYKYLLRSPYGAQDQSMEIYDPWKTYIKTYLGYGYLRLCKGRKKTHVAYMGKLDKTIKTSPNHKFKLGAHI
jgi:hypothetical protein